MANKQEKHKLPFPTQNPLLRDQANLGNVRNDVRIIRKVVWISIQLRQINERSHVFFLHPSFPFVNQFHGEGQGLASEIPGFCPSVGGECHIAIVASWKRWTKTRTGVEAKQNCGILVARDIESLGSG